MSPAKRRWSIRLTDAAEGDFLEIVAWTAANFGVAQAETYAETLTDAIETLAKGPPIAGARSRDDIWPGVLTLRVRKRHRKGRHFIVFRMDHAKRETHVLRLLHDSMDLARHVNPED